MMLKKSGISNSGLNKSDEKDEPVKMNPNNLLENQPLRRPLPPKTTMNKDRRGFVPLLNEEMLQET